MSCSRKPLLSAARLLALAGLLAAAFAIAAVGASAPPPVAGGAHEGEPQLSAARALAAYRRLPLVFAANRGQDDPRVRFRARGDGCGISLGDGAAELCSGAAVPLRLELAGALPAATPRGEGVRYPGVWPGVDLVFYGRDGRVEHDFLVGPGADPRRIRLRPAGAAGPRLDARGDLVLRDGPDGVRLTHPVAYQEAGGFRHEVAARYRLLPRAGGPPEIGFELGAYDRSLPLVVDPVLVYSTRIAGTTAISAAMDAAGNAYVTGAADAAVVPGALQLNGGRYPTDVFVAKLDPRGALVYLTVFGGSYYDVGASIAVDPQGNPYVAGQTYSYDLPYGPSGPPGPPPEGEPDDFIEYGAGFVAKLDPRGTSIVYTRLLGGGYQYSGSWATDVAVDSHGRAYVAGYEQDLPYLTSFEPDGSPGPSPFDLDDCATRPGMSRFTALAVDGQDDLLATGLSFDSEAFVGKETRAGQAVYSVCLGGSGDQFTYGIAAGPHGDAYVTGLTFSTDFPLVSPLQATAAGGREAFVIRLDPAGAIVYSTYLGGSGNDDALGIGVDARGRAYVLGETTSPDFPLVGPLASSCHPGPSAACIFLAALAADGRSLQYSTFVAGPFAPGFFPSPENGPGEWIGVDPRGVAVLALGGVTAVADDAPPRCDAAFAVPATLWPPDHRLVPIAIRGVTDPEDDPLTLAVTGVSEDEPPAGGPDAAGLGTATASVRAERAGSGDGRVYHVRFTATDAAGGSCTGSVAVCVPHDAAHRTCGDGGALYGSTGG